jgi:hypothetical protein
MSKLIRHTQKRGTALFVALQLTALTFLSLVSFIGGPQQPAKAPAGSQVSAPQTQTAQAPTATVTREALRSSAVYANKVYGARATQIFNLAITRAESSQQSTQQGQQSMQQGDLPNDAPTLTSDQEDYPPYS